MSRAARLAWRFIMMLVAAGVGALIGVIFGVFLTILVLPAVLMGALGMASAAQILLIAGAAVGALAGLVILHQQ